jgi:hypothetical protein
MTRMHLEFFKGTTLELDEIEFLYPSQKESILSIRGKTACGRFADGTFQWTSALKGLALLFLKHAAGRERFMLTGGAGSPACSVDFAISKQPRWVEEVFGTDKQGISLVRRIIVRKNSNRKRPGPVSIGLSSSPLSRVSISVSVNGRLMEDKEELNNLAEMLARQIQHEELCGVEEGGRRLQRAA